MSIGVGQVLLLVLFGLLLFGNPKEQLRDLGKGLRRFADELKKPGQSEKPAVTSSKSMSFTKKKESPNKPYKPSK